MPDRSLPDIVEPLTTSPIPDEDAPRLLNTWGVSSEPVSIPIDHLHVNRSPRIQGEDSAHVSLLAQSHQSMPPIIVHRPTMQVIDGLHRLKAAQLRGQCDIDVTFYGGDENDAFVLAVRMNSAHGLPLSIDDRLTAATQIISSHPHWSDRMISAITGLSAKTVAETRHCSSDDGQQSNIRIGRDGRSRPISTVAKRKRASEILASHPETPLRQVAQQSGLAPSTVQDVRKRLSTGQDPVPQGQQTRMSPEEDRPGASHRDDHSSRPDVAGHNTPLATLQSDPLLRYSKSGRVLLQALHAADPTRHEVWPYAIDSIPQHCAELVAQQARYIAMVWSGIAADCDRRKIYP